VALHLILYLEQDTIHTKGTCITIIFLPENSETCFTVGVQGISKDDIPTIEAAIDKTFRQAILDGLDRSLIESSLHNIELSIKVSRI
jgi:Zn-dependent M16 (insulinase) family peptidase